MTPADHLPAAELPWRLRLLTTGVTRLAGSGDAPVILLPDLPHGVADAVAPLLARRREVHVVEGAEALTAPAVDGLVARLRQAAPERGLAVVGSGLASALARVMSAGSSVRIVVAHPHLVEAEGYAAATGHPVETAHLIDSLLRSGSRHPSGAVLGRARP